MFLVFSVLSFLAISMAPTDASELSFSVEDQHYKVRRCGADEWCFLDSVPENPVSATTTGHLLVLSFQHDVSEIDISDSLNIAPEIDWTTIAAIPSTREGVQLVFHRADNVISVGRASDGAESDYATIIYGRPLPGDTPK